MSEAETDREAIAEEERRLRRLRLLVDIAAAALRGYPMSRPEAEALLETLRVQVLSMFPDKGETFDLIYGPRFRRLIDERFGSE